MSRKDGGKRCAASSRSLLGSLKPHAAPSQHENAIALLGTASAAMSVCLRCLRGGVARHPGRLGGGPKVGIKAV
jgi:hypothetical protein